MTRHAIALTEPREAIWHVKRELTVHIAFYLRQNPFKCKRRKFVFRENTQAKLQWAATATVLLGTWSHLAFRHMTRHAMTVTDTCEATFHVKHELTVRLREAINMQVQESVQSKFSGLTFMCHMTRQSITVTCASCVTVLVVQFIL